MKFTIIVYQRKFQKKLAIGVSIILASCSNYSLPPQNSPRATLEFSANIDATPKFLTDGETCKGVKRVPDEFNNLKGGKTPLPIIAEKKVGVVWIQRSMDKNYIHTRCDVVTTFVPDEGERYRSVFKYAGSNHCLARIEQFNPSAEEWTVVNVTQKLSSVGSWCK